MSSEPAIVVLGYGSGGEHVPLLDALLDDGVGATRLTLVHNPAGDNGHPPVSRPGVALLRMPANVGYAAGMNAGLRRRLDEGAELVVLLTHDCRPRPGALARLVAAARAAPDFGILAPVLWSRDTATPWSYGGIRLRSGEFDRRTEPPTGAGADPIAEADWVDGAALVLRAAALRRTGLFDERFFMYCEEADLCLRARRAGWRVGVVLDAQVEQSCGSPARPGAYHYLTARNGLECARRAGGRRAAARLAGTQARQALRLVKWLLKEPLDPVARRSAATELTARCAGMADFARGRWGPPPRWLPGLGDVRP